MYKVLFIGSNPSQKSKSVIPFWYDTKSTQVLNGWMAKARETADLKLESVHFLNVVNNPTPGNRPLKTSEVKDALPLLKAKIEEIAPDKIVTLGKTADGALTLLRIDHLAMPHPSGLNRQLNDPKFVEEKIKGLGSYLRPSTSID